ncbi:MAG: hypothetical protein ACQEP3_00115 [Patescibacteria group bacterium]
MTTISSFLIIASTVFLCFLFLAFIFKKSSIEFITLMTFLVILTLGLGFLNIGVEVLPMDLVFFSISLSLVYIFFSIKKSRGGSTELTEVNKIEKLAIKIYKNRSEIFKKIEKKGSLEDYFYLKIEYEKGNVKNENFQKKYKNFYNMYVFGFTEEFYNKYFQFLDEGETDLRKILNELSKIKDKRGNKSVQLAFATKLIHTVDTGMPLYNSTVADVFNLAIAKGTIVEKIESSLKIYNQLKSYHGSLAAKDEVKKTIIEFREKNNFKEGILSNAKLIDLLIRGSQEL